jgi:tRNA(Ile)-lysidine synthetase-like protein
VARALIVDLERRARAQLSQLAQYRDGGLVLSATELACLPEDVAVETLRVAAVEQGATSPLRGPAQRALHRVLSNQPVRRAIRVGGAQVERSGRWIRVGMAAPLPVAARRWQLPGELALSEVGLTLDARCLPAGAAYELPRHGATVAFDADRIPSSVVVRARRAGDRFAPFGGPGPRRLKSFLIDAGIPRWRRASIPLLVADGEIVWVVGLRRGLAAPVTPRTKRILEVTVRSPLAVPMPTE